MSTKTATAEQIATEIRAAFSATGRPEPTNADEAADFLIRWGGPQQSLEQALRWDDEHPVARASWRTLHSFYAARLEMAEPALITERLEKEARNLRDAATRDERYADGRRSDVLRFRQMADSNRSLSPDAADLFEEQAAAVEREIVRVRNEATEKRAKAALLLARPTEGGLTMGRHLTPSEAWADERRRVAARNPAAALPGVVADSQPRWSARRRLVLIAAGASVLWLIGFYGVLPWALRTLDAIRYGGGV